MTDKPGDTIGEGERMDKMAELLATYLTGSNVAAASIGLELGGHALTMAQPYFALREALGIKGYATRDEALRAIHALRTRTASSTRGGL